MNWFSGTLKIWHTDASGWAKPDYVHLMLTLHSAQKILDEYPHPVAFSQYEPSNVSMTKS